MPDPTWRTSSFSVDKGDCVEVAVLRDGTIGVRDSKDPHGPMLTFSRAALTAWLTACRAGEFDPCV